jgi:hypothetical protein
MESIRLSKIFRKRTDWKIIGDISFQIPFGSDTILLLGFETLQK